jgi:formamidopyrimidine-DNA glycosylase
VVRVPELPEVEVKRKYIEETSLGRVIDRVAAKKTRILRNVTPAKLSRDLKGQKFVEARRRAKYLLIATSEGDTLLMHFGMTGDAVFRSKGEAVPKFDKVEFHFSDGNALHFTDIRLFGRIALYETTDEREIPDVSGLGPEPLDRSFTFAKFSAIVRSHNTTIHQLLMEQQLIAGIGNIYSDEITYQADASPRDRAERGPGRPRRRLPHPPPRKVRRVPARPPAPQEDHSGKKQLLLHGGTEVERRQSLSTFSFHFSRTATQQGVRPLVARMTSIKWKEKVESD